MCNRYIQAVLNEHTAFLQYSLHFNTIKFLLEFSYKEKDTPEECVVLMNGAYMHSDDQIIQRKNTFTCSR